MLLTAEPVKTVNFSFCCLAKCIWRCFCQLFTPFEKRRACGLHCVEALQFPNCSTSPSGCDVPHELELPSVRPICLLSAISWHRSQLDESCLSLEFHHGTSMSTAHSLNDFKFKTFNEKPFWISLIAVHTLWTSLSVFGLSSSVTAVSCPRVWPHSRIPASLIWQF